MRRSRSGYNSYRGRRTLNDILKVIAAVLAVLVVLALAALLWGQRFIVFTDNGLRLDIPSIFGGDETPAVDPGSISVVIDSSGGQEEEPEETGQATVLMSALELPLQSVLDGTAAQELEQAGANALVLEMKDQEGTLAWYSTQELAAALGVSTGTEEINEALRQWNAGEVYTVARVCCFRDNTVPYQRNSMALRASYGNWRDELGLRWMNPGSQEAGSYLAQLCGELAELGFDEILLECCAFPTQGNVEAISWGDMAGSTQREQAIEAFLSGVRQALEPYGAVLSVRLDGRSGPVESGAESGLTAGVLERCAGRVWIASDETEEALADRLEQAGITGGTQRLVIQKSSLAERSGTAQAVLRENGETS